MRSSLIISVLVLLTFSHKGYSQGFTRQTYHDPEKKNIKEVYQVKDTIRNVLHGKYVSYYLNGAIESKGQFTDNETSGVWEFYYETGKLKMRGILFKSANYGMWEYFYESGKKSMEGIVYGKNRAGEWKTFYENGALKENGEYKDNKHIGLWKYYFEDGLLKGEINYVEDEGVFTEYNRSGKVAAKGPRVGIRNTGYWRYFNEEGVIQSEGEYQNGKRNGTWTNYYTSGKLYSKGNYVNDVLTGPWEYYYENGTINSTGEYVAGNRSGYWKTFKADGTLKSDITYDNGVGEYREYYTSGKVKSKGIMKDGKRHGKWEFFYEDGKLEGECNFENDKGIYQGYYATGKLQTKGPINGELKTGTWEIYEENGKLSGYYRPFYNNQKTSDEIVAMTSKNNSLATKTKSKSITYFNEQPNEFQGVIFGTNPAWLAAGELPITLEFYLQERLGYEFEFIGIRDPFFKTDADVSVGEVFQRGYDITVKQKFYNSLKVGMWYFGHEIRFTNLGHFVNMPIGTNPDNIFTFTAMEQRLEWGPILGYRLMRKNNRKGFTLDAFLSYGIGYKKIDVESNTLPYFPDIDQANFSHTFNFGLNFGRVFSFK